MGSLFSAIQTAASSLSVISQGLQTTENNVANANTPGYARQSLNVESLPFDISVGLPGGVISNGTQSSRDPYAEQGVRTQQSAS